MGAPFFSVVKLVAVHFVTTTLTQTTHTSRHCCMTSDSVTAKHALLRRKAGSALHVSKVFTQGTRGSAPGTCHTRRCRHHGTFGHRGSTWRKRVTCKRHVDAATSIIVASTCTCSHDAERRGAPKKGAIFWPKNGSQKGEGRLSAFTLWGANFGPH